MRFKDCRYVFGHDPTMKSSRIRQSIAFSSCFIRRPEWQKPDCSLANQRTQAERRGVTLTRRILWSGLKIKTSELAGIPTVKETLAKATQQVNDQKNQQHSSQSYSRTTAITPATMAVVPTTTPEQQDQNDDQYQHSRFSLSDTLIAEARRCKRKGSSRREESNQGLYTRFSSV